MDETPGEPPINWSAVIQELDVRFPFPLKQCIDAVRIRELEQQVAALAVEADTE